MQFLVLGIEIQILSMTISAYASHVVIVRNKIDENMQK